MIKKIVSIKNMAVFNDFEWKKSVRDKGNNVAEFKKINIFYGRNYSGKTTISRIFRAMETNHISDKYQQAEFLVEFENNVKASHADLQSHNKIIRVFNEDFVRDNLSFIKNSEEDIKSFAILGDDNNRIEQEITEIENELGSEESGTGLMGELKRRTAAVVSAESTLREAEASLKDKLDDKANKKGSGIKHNKLYGDANYNVPKLIQDIEIVTSAEYKPVTEKVDQLHLLIKEDAKKEITKCPEFNLKFTAFAKAANELATRRITISSPIQELLDNAVLSQWVRNGRILHEDKRTTCGFCGSPLPADIWDKLDKHFNRESEDLRIAIEDLISQINNESRRTNLLINFDCSAFYSAFSAELNAIKEEFEKNIKKYLQSLGNLRTQLSRRLEDLYNPGQAWGIEDVSDQLNLVYQKYDRLRIDSNNYTASLSKKQSMARNDLRLHEVYTFIHDINYSDELEKIKKYMGKVNSTKNAQTEIQTKIDELKRKIENLKTQLKDERKGADSINRYLNDYFGHDSLSLKAEESEQGCRFVVTRNNKRAHHLSEGECSLIAFCYFMAKLEDVDTKGKQPIIWIDDPISSLDINHVFFVYSLIFSKIVNAEIMEQLFISTHNLDFLKYLKRLPGADSLAKSTYFIIERAFSGSRITLMPDYLKNYVTEFNYLFHQLYKCAKADCTSDADPDCYYNFGNNARKFLESFLYYKYPNAKKNDNDKLVRFLGDDDLAAAIIKRINNEYSHLEGALERSTIPIDVPEMKRTAEYILAKIREHDSEQYNALLESIGAEEIKVSSN